MAKPESLSKRLLKLAKEVEKEQDFRDAVVFRTLAGNLAMAYVEPLDG